jgi:hypothetical protein
LLTISSYIFKLDFRPLEESKVKLYDFREDKLVQRIKKMLKERPFELFCLWKGFDSEYEKTTLRRFLIERGIKFSREEVVTLEQKTMVCLETMKAEEVIDLMFCAKENDDIYLLNLEQD